MKKIGNSFKGILVGIILIIVGCIMLWSNENNNVKNIKSTNEYRDNVISISSEKVDTANNSKLVNVSGELKIEGEVTDPVFNISLVTARLVRTVEMYQWEEDCTTDDDGDETCTYSKTWSDDLIDSSSFQQSSTHSNPAYMPISSEEYNPVNATMGAFNVSEEQLSQLPDDKTYNITEEVAGYTIVNNYYMTSTNVNSPEVGDIRVKFTYNDSKNITILAMQQDSDLITYVSEQGKSLNKASDGIKSADQMITEIEKANKFTKWLFRGIGWLLLVIGFSALFGPISTLASFVPIVGSIVGTATGIVGLALGSVVALVVIAIAWIVFRPLVGIALLVVAAGIAYLFIKKNKNKKVEQPVQTVSVEPVQPTVTENPLETVTQSTEQPVEESNE